MMDTEMILVTAPNEAGRKFIKLLMYKNAVCRSNQQCRGRAQTP